MKTEISITYMINPREDTYRKHSHKGIESIMGKYMRYVKTLQYSGFFHVILYFIKPLLRLMGIAVQLLPEMRGFLQYVLIIYQNWTIYTYVALVLKETVINILYKYLHFYG